MSDASNVLTTHRLTKAYGSRRAVVDLDLEVRRGEVFGFIGPNGAGKTTTIRMLLGLVRPTAGRVELFGRDVATHGDDVLPRVGALVEAPAFYPYLSGRDNLRAVASVLGGTTAARLDEVLELVDLRGRQRDRVRSYSLGMKQRLGVATALLDDPDLLVLDEPANRPGPRRHPRDARPDALARRVRQDGVHLQPRPGGGAADVRPGRDRQPRPAGEAGARVRADGRQRRVRGAARRAARGAGAARRPALGSRGPRRGRRGRVPVADRHRLGLVDFLVSHGQRPDGLVERRQTLEDIFLALTGTAHGGMS